MQSLSTHYRHALRVVFSSHGDESPNDNRKVEGEYSYIRRQLTSQELNRFPLRLDPFECVVPCAISNRQDRAPLYDVEHTA